MDEEFKIVSDLSEDEKVKQEEFLKTRHEILSHAVSGRIDSARDKVAYILNNFISARDSDIELAWLYWTTFESDKFNGNYITKNDLFNLTGINSLTRIRAKIQNEYKLFQASDVVKRHRGVLEQEKRQEAIEDKPSYPFYTIYIDETGKTQDYVSVGSLWDIDAKSSFFTLFKLRQWLRDKEIDFEFHFAELSNHKLEIYKAFFLHFLTLYPSVGFKVIIVKRSGLKNLNSAITDLTFHLINNGIKHENSTGRAPLPRSLQVYIDREEEGSDNLKLENIKERLISQQIDGLHIDSLEAIDSKDNLYVQIVDLFISSVNRRLHNQKTNTQNGNSKDEFADYVLRLLSFDITNIENSTDNSMVFNLKYNN